MAYLVSILRSRRLWGLSGTALAFYLILFVWLGKTDMSWIMPDTHQLAKAVMEVWPRLPIFQTQKEPVGSGDANVIYYTVPTRQLTPQELADMGVTNHVAKPAPPK